MTLVLVRLTKLIELNKGTNNLKYNPDDISVSNNDYKEALRSYDLKSEFKKNNGVVLHSLCIRKKGEQLCPVIIRLACFRVKSSI